MFYASYQQYRLKVLLVLPVVLVLLLGSPAAANLSKGSEAAESGNDATSLKEWGALAEQGDSDAQFNMGIVYLQGLGVTQDYQAAFKWFKKATEQKHAIAQFSLGAMYLQGLGVSQDYKVAFNWFKKAAEQGGSQAQSVLSSMYEEGIGIPQDYTRAHMWLNIAASLGNESAVGNRDKVEKMMTPSQIKIAGELANECVAKNYKGC